MGSYGELVRHTNEEQFEECVRREGITRALVSRLISGQDSCKLYIVGSVVERLSICTDMNYAVSRYTFLEDRTGEIYTVVFANQYAVDSICGNLQSGTRIAINNFIVDLQCSSTATDLSDLYMITVDSSRAASKVWIIRGGRKRSAPRVSCSAQPESVRDVAVVPEKIHATCAKPSVIDTDCSPSALLASMAQASVALPNVNESIAIDVIEASQRANKSDSNSSIQSALVTQDSAAFPCTISSVCPDILSENLYVQSAQVNTDSALGPSTSAQNGIGAVEASARANISGSSSSIQSAIVTKASAVGLSTNASNVTATGSVEPIASATVNVATISATRSGKKRSSVTAIGSNKPVASKCAAVPGTNASLVSSCGKASISKRTAFPDANAFNMFATDPVEPVTSNRAVVPSKSTLKTSSISREYVALTDVAGSSTTTPHVTAASAGVLSRNTVNVSAATSSVASTSNAGLKSNNQESNNQAKKTMPAKNKGPPYDYVDLATLAIGNEYCVYGLVKFVMEPVKTRGTDWRIMFSITDKSIHEQRGEYAKIKCLIFDDVDNLPPVKVGDIIRLHRLKMSSFNNEPQGQKGFGFSWLVFDSEVDGSEEPIAKHSGNYTWTNADVEKLRELREWAAAISLSEVTTASADSQTISDQLVTLSQVSEDKYFDFVCQVLAVSVIEELGREICWLRVWDGTKMNVSSLSQPISKIPDVRLDKRLLALAKDLAVDLWIYDEYCEEASLCQPGDYVLFANMHSLRVNRSTLDGRPALIDYKLPNGELPQVQLTFHGGGEKFNRKLVIYKRPSESAEVVRLCDRLHAVRSTAAQQGSSGVETNQQTAGNMLAADMAPSVGNVPSAGRASNSGNVLTSSIASSSCTARCQTRSDIDTVPDKSRSADESSTSQSVSWVTTKGETVGSVLHQAAFSSNQQLSGSAMSQSSIKAVHDISSAVHSPMSSQCSSFYCTATGTVMPQGSPASQVLNETSSDGEEFFSSKSDCGSQQSQEGIQKKRSGQLRAIGSVPNVGNVPSAGSVPNIGSVPQAANLPGSGIALNNGNASQLSVRACAASRTSGATTVSSTAPRVSEQRTVRVSDGIKIISATGIADEYDCMKPSCINEINRLSLDQARGSFRAVAYITDYQPRATSAVNFLRLHCPHCRFVGLLPGCESFDEEQDGTLSQDYRTWHRYAHPIDSSEKMDSDELICNYVNDYHCPRCLQEQDQETLLEYVYMLQLVLWDHTGSLVACLWNSEAETFFNAPARQCLTNPATFFSIQKRLNDLLSSGECMGNTQSDILTSGECVEIINSQSKSSSAAIGQELSSSTVIGGAESSSDDIFLSSGGSSNQEEAASEHVGHSEGIKTQQKGDRHSKGQQKDASILAQNRQTCAHTSGFGDVHSKHTAEGSSQKNAVKDTTAFQKVVPVDRGQLSKDDHLNTRGGVSEGSVRSEKGSVQRLDKVKVMECALSSYRTETSVGKNVIVYHIVDTLLL